MSKVATNLTEIFLSELHSAGRAVNTVKNYRVDLGAFQGFLGRPIERTKPNDLRQYFLTLGGLSSASRARKQACLSAFFSWCVKNELVDKNPMEVITRVKVQKKLPRPMPDDELKKVIAEITDERDLLLVKLLRDTGCRISEALNTDVEDYNLNTGAESVFITETKNGEEREVFFPHKPELISALTSYLKPISQGPVFRNYLGERLSVRGAQDNWTKWCEAAGVDHHKWTIHTIRHYYVTNELRAGVPIQIVSRQAGHKSIEITMRYNEIDRDHTLTALLQRG